MKEDAISTAREEFAGEARLRPGKAIVKGPLGVCPLYRRADGRATYLTYAQALDAGAVAVRELGDAGSVPELVLENKGDELVLILDGEQLIGARQNRVMNTTVLIGAAGKVVIPVSCVEQGRWHYEGTHEMRSSAAPLYARTRAMKSQQVLERLQTHNEYTADQHAIWESISTNLAEDAVYSPTSAMKDHFTSRRDGLAKYLDAFSLDRFEVPDGLFMVGAVFTLSGKILGMDSFNLASTLSRQWEQLINSYGIEAALAGDGGSVDPGEVEAFLTNAGRARMQVFDPPGLGDDVRMSDAAVVGSALVYEHEVIHQYAFAVEDERRRDDDTSEARMCGYRHRLDTVRSDQRNRQGQETTLE